MNLENYYEESVNLYCLVDYSDNSTRYYALTDFESKKIYDYCKDSKTLVFTQLDPDFFNAFVKYAAHIFI